MPEARRADDFPVHPAWDCIVAIFILDSKFGFHSRSPGIHRVVQVIVGVQIGVYQLPGLDRAQRSMAEVLRIWLESKIASNVNGWERSTERGRLSISGWPLVNNPVCW